MGNADDMRATADDLDRIDASITATYASRSGQTPAKVRALLKEDRLMDAKEAKSLGYADEVVKEIKLAANFPLRMMPKAAADRFRNVTGHGSGPGPAERGAFPLRDNPTPLASAEVIDLNAAKSQGVEEHRAYVAGVTDLCVLADAPERVGQFVRDATPLDEVRKQLLEHRAAKAQQQPVLSLHPVVAKPTDASMWSKITDKINARNAALKGGH
jgi:hypothetical protein